MDRKLRRSKRNLPSTSNISSAQDDNSVTESKTVEIPVSKKRKTTEGDDDLYKVIVEAIAIRKRLETHPNNWKFIQDLQFAEGKIPCFANFHKACGVLARDWEYDPDPAAVDSLVPKKLVADEGLIEKDEEQYERERREGWSCRGPPIDPNREYPDTCCVYLNDEEEKIWEEFKEFDKETPALHYVCLVNVEKIRRTIEVDNPVVGLIGHFAVAAFNETIEMCVKKGEKNNLHDYVFKECKFIKTLAQVIFNMTIEGIEEGILGVYETRVVCKPADDGFRTLTNFVLTDRRPDGKKNAVKTPSHTTNPDDWCDPEDDYYSGLKRRPKSTTCPGYDFNTPWGFSGP